MKKIWKISNQINSTDLEIQPLECQDIFIQDFSIQKEKLMTSFLNKKSLESSNILRHSKFTDFLKNLLTFGEIQIIGVIL